MFYEELSHFVWYHIYIGIFSIYYTNSLVSRGASCYGATALLVASFSTVCKNGLLFIYCLFFIYNLWRILNNHGARTVHFFAVLFKDEQKREKLRL